MESDLCRTKLNKFISYLPKYLKYKYILCENTEELFDKAEKILKIDKEKIKKNSFKNLSSSKYWKGRKIERTPNNTIILGLSTNPILLNSGEIKNINTIIFTYLHEVGHLLGYIRRHKSSLHSEEIADKIATYWFKKLKKEINEIFIN